MRISDWSSDVCSSELPDVRVSGVRIDGHAVDLLRSGHDGGVAVAPEPDLDRPHQALGGPVVHQQRSDERRVGNGRVSTCSSRWSRYHSTKKTSAQVTTSTYTHTAQKNR